MEDDVLELFKKELRKQLEESSPEEIRRAFTRAIYEVKIQKLIRNILKLLLTPMRVIFNHLAKLWRL